MTSPPWRNFSPDFLADLIEAMPAAVMLTDKNAQICAVNAAFERVTGYSKAEISGKNPRVLSSGRHDEEFYREFWGALGGAGRWQGQVWNRRKNGEVFPEWLDISRIKTRVDGRDYYLAVFSDITALKRADQEIIHLAFHDPLTGLANRRLFDDRLMGAVARSARSGDCTALLLLDLDNFKDINDQYGHPSGDAYLQRVANVLVGSVRKTDTVARLGGDEFAVILEHMSSVGKATETIEKLFDKMKLVDRIVENGDAPPGHPLRTSGGVAVFPQHARDATMLFSLADAALYQAKRDGKHRVCFHHQDEEQPIGL